MNRKPALAFPALILPLAFDHLHATGPDHGPLQSEQSSPVLHPHLPNARGRFRAFECRPRGVDAHVHELLLHCLVARLPLVSSSSGGIEFVEGALRGGVEQLEHVLGVVVELVGDLGVELQELREVDDEGEMELAVREGEEDAAEVVGVEAVEETV